MGNYNLGLSTSSSSQTTKYSLNLEYKSLFAGQTLSDPVVVEMPPQETWALYQQVEKQFAEKRSMLQRVESSITAAVNLDLGSIDPKIIELVARSLRASAPNYTKSPKESLNAMDATFLVGWIGLPDGYSVLVGLDHRDQPKAFGLSIREFQISDNTMMKLHLMYDERGAFGGEGN